MSLVPTVKLNNGHDMPVLGLGTWRAKPGEVTEAVKYAIDIGYRHFECVPFYEAELGVAIKAKITEGVVKRDDLFITSQFRRIFLKRTSVERTMRETLRNLGLHYLDLYLIEPTAFKEPFGSDGELEMFSDVDYLDTWKELEKLLSKGLTKSIGVSKFNERQLERIINNSEVVPVTNKVECSPYSTRKKLLDFCTSKGITLTAYNTLGSPYDPKNVLTDPRIQNIAEKYNKTSAQIILRYLVQHGVIPIPKSINPKRIAENINILDFELSSEDKALIDTFDCNRITPPRFHLITVKVIINIFVLYLLPRDFAMECFDNSWENIPHNNKLFLLDNIL